MKQIEARLDWLTSCGVILMAKLGEVLHIEFPPPPPEKAVDKPQPLA